MQSKRQEQERQTSGDQDQAGTPPDSRSGETLAGTPDAAAEWMSGGTANSGSSSGSCWVSIMALDSRGSVVLSSLED